MGKIRIICLCALILSWTGGVYAAEDVKEPNVAGAFYPSEPKDLAFYVDAYVKQAGEGPLGEPVVLIAPHAGYVYSGPVAGYAYAAVKGRHYDTVVILAVSHHFPFMGAAVYPQGAFQTPLGQVPVDRLMTKALLEKAPGITFVKNEYFEKEHSLEVHLPFLQSVLAPGFKILPLMIGDLSLPEARQLAKALQDIVGDARVLVVVSTDLSHYKTYDEACALDQKTVGFVEKRDVQGLWDAVADTGWNVCGIRPVAVGMAYAQLAGASRVKILQYANSGDTAGDKSRVVGYLAAAFYKEETVQKKDEGTMSLTKQEKKRLLQIARATMEASVSGRTLPVFSEGAPGLNLRRGAFVTLTRRGQLRGCIGLFSSREPLYKVVGEMAVEASGHDYRFTPVAPDELKDVTIEISVLSDPARISDWRKIRLGTDGVIVRRGFQSGVFLPQVATETKWDLETFLGELCSQKAGLPWDSYKDPDTQLLTFQADVFSENEST
jgi:AmmeMemoRadiSam system protein B/AmmeMemoRadiSam system protein A